MPASVETYLLLATEQAVRVLRGSSSFAMAIGDGEIRDRFLIADAAAVDRWIARNACGFLPQLLAFRKAALAGRPGLPSSSPREHDLELLVRKVLGGDPLQPTEDLPLDGSGEDAARWARAMPEPTQLAVRHRPMALPDYWGQPLAPGAVLPGAAGNAAEHTSDHRRPRPRAAEMRRRPRVRHADEDEDDRGAGTWVIKPDEPQESVEDPFGLQRPIDRADDVDPEGLGDSLSELPEARVVRTPDPARDVLLSEGDIPKGAPFTTSIPAGTGLAYPEWDYRTSTYRLPGAIVRDVVARHGDPAWVSSVLARHRRLVRRVRTRFERLRPRRTSIDRQPDGPELDIAAYVNAAADARAAGTADDRLYIALRRARRELSVAVLVDTSASTDAWVTGNRRIVDVEKEALLVVCEALDALGDRHAIFAFSGEGPEAVSVTHVKTFAEQTSAAVRQRIAALESDRYTRMGAAIRHATTALNGEATQRRLLLILSDGKPNDVDAYEGRYGIEDARRAVTESRSQSVHVFCLTVDRAAPAYAPRIFGSGGFTVLKRPDDLPVVIVDVLRHLIRP
jgi:nitric oxide reductase NorD protein